MIKYKYLFFAFVQLLVLMTIAMFGTYLHEYLISINWFNDPVWTQKNYWGIDEVRTEWSARHNWYMAICITLFVGGLFRIIIYILDKEETKKIK